MWKSKLKGYGEMTENCTNSHGPGKLKFAGQFWGCNISNMIYKILGALFVIFVNDQYFVTTIV